MEYIQKTLKIIGFIYRHAQIIFGGAYVSALIIEPTGTIQITHDLLHANDSFILKVATGYTITYVFFKTRKHLQAMIVDTMYKLTNLFFNERHNELLEESDLLENIPKSELIDFILSTKTLNIKQATEYFLVPQNKIEKLAKKLEDVRVLIRGENNARVLNDEYGRQDIACILNSADTIDAIEPLFKKTAQGFTSVPVNCTM